MNRVNFDIPNMNSHASKAPKEASKPAEMGYISMFFASLRWSVSPNSKTQGGYMSAPTKVNSDIPLIDRQKMEAAKPPQNALVLKVHETLEGMRETLEAMRPSTAPSIKRESAFRDVQEMQDMVKESDSEKKE